MPSGPRAATVPSAPGIEAVRRPGRRAHPGRTRRAPLHARAVPCHLAERPPGTVAGSGLPPEPGIGLPWGQVLGFPRISTRRASTSSEITCSHRSASACTLCHGSPITSVSSRSAKRCLRMTLVASFRPGTVRDDRPSLDLDVAGLLETVHHFGHGGRRVADVFGQAGLYDLASLLFEVEDRLQVLFVREGGRRALPRCWAYRESTATRGRGYGRRCAQTRADDALPPLINRSSTEHQQIYVEIIDDGHWPAGCHPGGGRLSTCGLAGALWQYSPSSHKGVRQWPC